ncbi:uroporphyrinogen decarboxylase family protein [Bacteroidota bacterium]
MTEEPNRIKIAAQMHDHVMSLTGIPARQFYTDARVMVEAFSEVADYYGMDIFRAAGDSYNAEIEAMGGKLIYGEHSMPTLDSRNPLLKEPQDLQNLKLPDFSRDGRLPYILDCIRLSREKEKGNKSGFFCGPFSLAVGLRGFPGFIKDIRKRPEFARELLDFIVDEVLVNYLKVQQEYCGVTMSDGFNAWASIPNLSAGELMEWVVPWSQRVREKAARFGMTVGCLDGDYCEERLEKFDPEVLHNAFEVQRASLGRPICLLGQGRWHEYPLEPVLDYTAALRLQGIQVPVIAWVNARLLRDGPVEAIIWMIKRFIQTFGRNHELSLHLANIPADTPSDHVHAAVAVVHAFGKKPIADNLDEIAFTPPRRETFQEWRAQRRKSANG